MKSHWLITILFLFFSIPIRSLNAQTTEGEAGKVRIAIANMHSYVPDIQSRETLVIPAWGLEAEYFIFKKWALASHFELEMLTYFVEGKEREVVERDYPMIISLLVLRELPKSIVFGLGYGREYDKNRDFDLINFNASRQIPLGNHWDFSPGITYNHRFNAFNSWSINLAFGRSL